MKYVKSSSMCLLLSRQDFNEGLFVIYNPSDMLFFPD